jgi:hypothetical protein
VAGGRAYFDDVTVSGRFPYILHDGMIGAAIASFVRLAQQTPALPARYREKATAYRAFPETEIVPRWESSGYYSLGFARMLAILYQVNGNATYLDRARRIGSYFKSRLRLSGAAYVWPYTSTASRMEDASHANIDIGTAFELHRIGQVFTATDMQRFANTLTQVMCGTDRRPHRR